MSQETTSKHTPGPWDFAEALQPSENHRGFVLYQDVDKGTRIADVMPVDEDGVEGEANARLIAAAPDLYVALKLLRGLHKTWQTDMTLMVGSSVWKLMNETIAKVEGRAS